MQKVVAVVVAVALALKMVAVAELVAAAVAAAIVFALAVMAAAMVAKEAVAAVVVCIRNNISHVLLGRGGNHWAGAVKPPMGWVGGRGGRMLKNAKKAKAELTD